MEPQNRLLVKETLNNTKKSNIHKLIKSLPNNNTSKEYFGQFMKTAEEILKSIKSLHHNCLTSHENIPVSMIKPSPNISSSLAYIINTKIAYKV